MLDLVNANGKQDGGQTVYPHMYGRLDKLERLRQGRPLCDLPTTGPEGWYEFRPHRFAPGALELYYWTLDRSALDLLPETPDWVGYLDGGDESFPERALQRDLDVLRRKVEMQCADLSTPDTTMSDDVNRTNPATTDALVQLVLGGVPIGRIGYPLHCRLRYFDPARRRAGLPEQVAALVERMTEDGVTLRLVNLDPVWGRTVILQGGAYAEHQLTTVRVIGSDGGERRASSSAVTAETAVDHSHFAVRLTPGAGARLAVG
jgi:hypothetical protein